MDKGKGKMPDYPPGYLKHPPPFYRNYPCMPNDENPKSSKRSYKNLSPYIQKPIPLRICYLDQTPDVLDTLDPNQVASHYCPAYSYFPVTSGKTRYFYELLLQDMLSCQIIHRYAGENLKRELRYPEEYETMVSYSKIIIYKVVTLEEYGHPNLIKKFFNTQPPPGLFPPEYNYWDYIDAFDKVLFYKKPVNQHSWFMRLDL